MAFSSVIIIYQLSFVSTLVISWLNVELQDGEDADFRGFEDLRIPNDSIRFSNRLWMQKENQFPHRRRLYLAFLQLVENV
jgi:hypothetical protein